MLSHEATEAPKFSLRPKDMRMMKIIISIIIAQCVFALIISITVFECMWKPNDAFTEFDLLARIMYLFDPESCKYDLKASKIYEKIWLSNRTFGFKLYAIKWTPVEVRSSSKLTLKARKNLELSVGLHMFWMVVAMLVRLFIGEARKARITNLVLSFFFYTTLAIVIYDAAMAVSYVSHIQQSITKGMIIRYSGWGGTKEVQNIDNSEFGGWIPICASICWLRGFFIWLLNGFFCRRIMFIRRICNTHKVKMGMATLVNLPFPEPQYDRHRRKNALYFRRGECTPHFS